MVLLKRVNNDRQRRSRSYEPCGLGHRSNIDVSEQYIWF